MKRNFIVSEHPQNTPEWFADRCGRATGSKAAAITAKVKSGEAATRADYRVQLALERLLVKPCADEFSNDDTDRGHEREPFARMRYEIVTGITVEQCGFVYREDIMAGCSPDGLLEDAGRLGLWEAKCPKSKTHFKYLLEQRVPPTYQNQVLHNMLVTGAEFVDFVSFDPDMPGKLQLFIFRWERDEALIKEYEAELRQFLMEVDATHKQIAAMAA
ncbi:lambda exonuclease family protein [Paraburkholderia sp. BR10872]|uniref:lambda exonuclease family protein n=1 Tax=Paraburkholderia sp. BR10872 TaxID=3236989 RepID=UPI0034D275E8